MGRPAGWMTALTGRSLMKSPGAPSHRGRSSASSGVRSPRGSPPRRPRSRSARRRRSAPGGSGTVAGCPRLVLLRCQAGICHFANARRSRSGRLRAPESGRSPAVWAGPRRQSRASCAVTPRPAAGSSTTVPRSCRVGSDTGEIPRSFDARDRAGLDRPRRLEPPLRARTRRLNLRNLPVRSVDHRGPSPSAEHCLMRLELTTINPDRAVTGG